MKNIVAVGLLALGGLLGSAAPAVAGHCGTCRYPRACVTADQCAPEACVASTICYQPVIEQCEKVCYRPVYKTCYRPETCTSYRTVHETCYTAEKYTVSKPIVEYFDVVRNYTVSRKVYETH